MQGNVLNLTNHEKQRARLFEKLSREFGEEILEALTNKDVIEIMVNPDGKLWIEKLGQDIEFNGQVIRGSQIENLIGTIASLSNKEINEITPILETELPFFNCRFAGIFPPLVAKPCFAIRKKALKVIGLEEYKELGIITTNVFDNLCAAILARQNILVVGGTGSGKTTFLNSLLNEISRIHPDHRIITIEDTLELQCNSPNHLSFKTNEFIDSDKCLKASLRLRPDRIIIGEVRGKEAHSLIKAWNTGHNGGVASIHANSAAMGMLRLEQLVQEANAPIQKDVLANTINQIVFITKIPKSPFRKVTEYIEVKGVVGENYNFNYFEEVKSE